MVTLTTSTNHPSALLVSKIQNGDYQAEADLIKKFSRAVNIVLRQQARSLQDAEDLFQDTFRIALEKIRKGELREPEKLGGFLVGTAKFTAIDFYRREGRYVSQEPLGLEPTHPQDNPLLTLLDQEKHSRLLELLPELKCQRDREILSRFYLSEEDKVTICKALNISPLHFGRVIHRAKKRLRELLKKHTVFQ